MEELQEYMIIHEKIKQIINCFKNDKCPTCGEKLRKRIINLKTHYRCDRCSTQFWENQFYEIYFDAIMKVVEK